MRMSRRSGPDGEAGSGAMQPGVSLCDGAGNCADAVAASNPKHEAANSIGRNARIRLSFAYGPHWYHRVAPAGK